MLTNQSSSAASALMPTAPPAESAQRCLVASSGPCSGSENKRLNWSHRGVDEKPAPYRWSVTAAAFRLLMLRITADYRHTHTDTQQAGYHKSSRATISSVHEQTSAGRRGSAAHRLNQPFNPDLSCVMLTQGAESHVFIDQCCDEIIFINQLTHVSLSADVSVSVCVNGV